MDGLSIAVFAGAIVAWASYLPVSKSPRLRRTMWPTLVLMAIVLLALIARAVLRGPGEVRFSALEWVSLATTLLIVPVYFMAFRVPRSGVRPQTGQEFPAVSFTALDGGALSSSELTRRGPMLFVFFRGFW